MNKATVILTTYNQKDVLIDTVKWLENVEGISNIIVVDNGSTDMTSEWLAGQQYEYIWFDEGAQGYAKIWNTVIENFQTEEYIIFMEAGIYPGRYTILRLMEILQDERVGIAGTALNQAYDNGDYVVIHNKEEFLRIGQNDLEQPDESRSEKLLTADWRVWAIRKATLTKNGRFQDNFNHPKLVMTDYMLRLVKNDFYQNLLWGCVYCSTPSFEEIYESVYNEKVKWMTEDMESQKKLWGISYFSLQYNPTILKYIQEEKEKEFAVLEIGCNFGATLFAIEAKYPNCRTFGLEINKTAVDVAKHVANVKYGDIDELKIPFTEKFDYIIFGDVLEHLRHPKEVLELCHGMLTENGHIIASIPNIMHISVMEELINGRFIYEDVGLLDKTHIHFFTYYEILQMLMDTHYQIEYLDRTQIGITDAQKKLEQELLKWSEYTEEWMYETFQYIVKVRRG